MIKETKFIIESSKGKLLKKPVTLEYRDGRIWFVKSPFALKDEIKAMQGARWHGFEDPPIKQWSVKDCPRNRFQIEYLEGGNPYEWFDRPVEEFVKPGTTVTSSDGEVRELWPQQLKMINAGLTYRYQIWGAAMGSGKSLSAIETMRRSGLRDFWWVGPKTTLLEIALQFEHWQVPDDIRPQMMTYEKMTSLVKSNAYNLPQGVVFDEASQLKTPGVARSNAAQKLCDQIREVHGKQGLVLLLSGTPSPKTPTDIWSLAEITWPGFLREGSVKALEQRVAVHRQAEKPGEIGGYYSERVAWLDEEGKCRLCGMHKDECSELQTDDPEMTHKYTPAINEVAHIHERLQGLMVVVHKRDCMTLPEKEYVEINLEPSPKLLKVGNSIKNTATTTVAGLAALRQLSDGFLYQEKPNGTKKCPGCNGEGEITEWFNPQEPERPYQSIELMDPEVCKNFEQRKVTCYHCEGEGEVTAYARETTMVPCPKDDVVCDLLTKAESSTGRIVIFAGFQGSVDRITKLCHDEDWTVFRCDGRGSAIYTPDGKQVTGAEPLRYWRDMTNQRVAFVANPESGGFGLTLTEACTAIFYSNSYKPQFRIQAEERIHRPGQTRGVKIYDLLHLPSDKRTLDIIRQNRKLEQMVLGDILGDCFSSSTGDS